MNLPRPRRAPRRIPLWAWHLNAWLSSGKRGPRPSRAPKRVPAWFWWWRLFALARAKGQGSRAWKRYMDAVHALPDPQTHIDTLRAQIVKWARYRAAHASEIHYSQGTVRDDFLHRPPGHLPDTTDCSGDCTENHWDARAPDPSGLDYRYVGFTGTILDHAAKHGRILYDMSLARPGDPIVIGPGTGWHVVTCLEAGRDPLVCSHGSESGPRIQRLSIDPRTPKRVCQTLI
jgi:hypothetical protein